MTHRVNPASASNKNDNPIGLVFGQLVREAAKLIKGGGGGAPHFATAGGKDLNGLTAAVDKVVELAGI